MMYIYDDKFYDFCPHFRKLPVDTFFIFFYANVLGCYNEVVFS